MPTKVLIIIPCYNEEKNIAGLLSSLEAIRINNVEITTLPVNDCSLDNTLLEIQKNTQRYLNLAVNLGIGGAVQSGLIYAQRNNFDIAVQLDGDGQHPPDELYKIIDPVMNGIADMCIGSRFVNKDKKGFQSSAARRTGIKFLSGLIRLFSGKTIHDCTSGYRAFNKTAIALCVNYYPDTYPEPESVLYLIKNKARVVETPVIMAERSGGVSSIGHLGSLYYMIKVSLAIIFLNLKNHSYEY